MDRQPCKTAGYGLQGERALFDIILVAKLTELSANRS
jgi:hypothetical protein